MFIDMGTIKYNIEFSIATTCVELIFSIYQSSSLISDNLYRKREKAKTVDIIENTQKHKICFSMSILLEHVLLGMPGTEDLINI